MGDGAFARRPAFGEAEDGWRFTLARVGPEIIFGALSNPFPSGIVKLLREPFRYRRTTGMENSNVDEEEIVCSGVGHSRCDERRGRQCPYFFATYM